MALKVGIGPGSICTTRVVTGAGVPQITAIMEASRAAEGTGVPIIADGGIKFFRRHHEGHRRGRILRDDRQPFRRHRRIPRRDHSLSGPHLQVLSRHGLHRRDGRRLATATPPSGRRRRERGKSVPEGVEGRVPYKGPLGALTDQLVGGLKSAWATVGAPTLNDLKTNGRFVRITTAGLRESHVHDVIITREAPNYRIE